jgi:hypothetical protein
MNRRNALVGWATLTLSKAWLVRRLRSGKEQEQEVARRWWRRGAAGQPPPPPPKKKRSKRPVLGLLMATLVGVGIWLGAKRAKQTPVEPWSTPAPEPAPEPVASEGEPVE